MLCNNLFSVKLRKPNETETRIVKFIISVGWICKDYIPSNIYQDAFFPTKHPIREQAIALSFSNQTTRRQNDEKLFSSLQ